MALNKWAGRVTVTDVENKLQKWACSMQKGLFNVGKTLINHLREYVHTKANISQNMVVKRSN